MIALILVLLLAPLAMAQNEHAFIWDSTNGMQDIGTLGGNSSYATGINNSGVVTGYSYLSDGTTIHAFSWTSSGGMVDIGTPLAGGISQATGINSSGNIAGWGNLAGTQTPAFYSAAGGWQVFPHNLGDAVNLGLGINDADQVTGQVYQGNVEYAFRWDTDSGKLHFLASIPGGTLAAGNGINSFGHVCGAASRSAGAAFITATLWVVPGRAVILGRVGNINTYAHSVNDNDEVVGFNNNSAGFYWSRSTGMVLLPSLGGDIAAGYRITNSGEIAGYSSTSASGPTHAALWSNYTSAPEDLGTLPGGTNSYGRDMNSSGMVVGYADVP